MKSTSSGSLNPIDKCVIFVPGAGRLVMNNLPEIGDSKNANYNNEPILGRTSPLYTYAHSGDRVISVQIHLFIVDPGDGQKNLRILRGIQSAVYPRSGRGGAPYTPPPVCLIRCGDLLGTQPLCVLLQSYQVRFPTEVAWDEETYCPYRFDIDTQWLTVYTSADLPNQDRIVSTGR